MSPLLQSRFNPTLRRGQERPFWHHFQMRKLRLKEMKLLAQRHTASTQIWPC